MEGCKEKCVLKKAKENGEFLKVELEKIFKDNQDLIFDIRGKGLLIGIEFKNENIAGLIIDGLADKGLLVNTPEVI